MRLGGAMTAFAAQISDIAALASCHKALVYVNSFAIPIVKRCTNLIL
jgi:hypothetical protein